MNRTLMMLACAVSLGVIVLTTQGNAYHVANADVAQLRMLIAGSGPAVVFENGMGAELAYWRRVQSEVQQFATTIAYDRAGVGGSSDGPLPRDARQVATELHAALRDSGVPPPYVLTGHSIGGLYVRVYAAMYPDEVAALVLVDASRHDEWDPTDFEGSAYPELDAMPAAMEQARAATLPAGLPVYAIVAMGAEGEPWYTAADSEARERFRAARQEDLDGHAAWINELDRGELIITENSGHNVPVEERALVIDTIRRALEAATRSP
jgi:pimeloyl-ACP methyl ester carboxylesterase